MRKISSAAIPGTLLEEESEREAGDTSFLGQGQREG